MGKKIAVLTSGGDAPGMNATLRAAIRAGIHYGDEMYVIYDGLEGLVNGDIEKVDKSFTGGIINRGGTVIRTARFPQFTDIEVQKKGVEQLEKKGIDAVIGIGGDGSYHGLLALSKLGVNVIGLPGTIDNDLQSSDETIGFNTTLETICDAVDKLKDTASSHQRCFVIEVMGRYCGDLALYASIAEGAEATITYDKKIPDEELYEKIRKVKAARKSHCIVIVSENLLDVNELAKKIQENTGYETRAQVLGHMQRGGNPSASDRILGARLGVRAVELINEGARNRVVGVVGGEVKDMDLEESLNVPRVPNEEFIKLLDILSE
ncbi:MAG: 6-phosphofructokinase [Coprobacillus sp.]|nr:6-phosphofructokinase [Coprobacillus sp.]